MVFGLGCLCKITHTGKLIQKTSSSRSEVSVKESGYWSAGGKGKENVLHTVLFLFFKKGLADKEEGKRRRNSIRNKASKYGVRVVIREQKETGLPSGGYPCVLPPKAFPCPAPGTNEAFPLFPHGSHCKPGDTWYTLPPSLLVLTMWTTSFRHRQDAPGRQRERARR